MSNFTMVNFLIYISAFTHSQLDTKPYGDDLLRNHNAEVIDVDGKL